MLEYICKICRIVCLKVGKIYSFLRLMRDESSIPLDKIPKEFMFRRVFFFQRLRISVLFELYGTLVSCQFPTDTVVSKRRRVPK